MGIGFSELLVIFVLGVLLLGPNKIPHLFRLIGFYYRKFKAIWHDIQGSLEQELRFDEMQKHPSQQQNIIQEFPDKQQIIPSTENEATGNPN